MTNGSEPLREWRRLASLRATGLLDASADPIFDGYVRLASELIGAPVSLLSLVDADRQFFSSQVGLSPPWSQERQTPLTHSFCQHVVLSDAPFVVEDARSHALVAENLAIPDLGVVAYAGVPVRNADGEILGAFCVIDSEPRAWSDRDVDVLRVISQAVTTELRARVAESHLASVLGGLPVVVFVLDTVTERIVSIEGDVEGVTGTTPTALMSREGAWDRLVEQQDRPIVRAARDEARNGVSRSIAYRITRSDGSRGWVQEYMHPQDDVAPAGALLQCAVVDVTPQRELADRLGLLNEISVTLAEAADVDEGLSWAVSRLGLTLGWDATAIWLPDDRGERLRSTIQWSRPEDGCDAFLAATRSTTLAWGEGVPGTVWASGELVWAPDLRLLPSFPRRAAADTDGLRAGLAVPILQGGSAVGAIELYSRETRELDAGLTQLLRSLGTQVGLFLERRAADAELRASREHYLAVARTFERSLVPPEPPAVAGLDVSTRFHPASDADMVGGDFLDIFRRSDGGWTISIGDVCGKGTAAAAITALVRHVIRGASLSGRSPADVLEIANLAILNEDFGERFCSALVLDVSEPDRDGLVRIQAANAGHPCPVRRRIDGGVDGIQGTGLVLGIFPAVDAPSLDIALQSGESLVVLTDGYLEARRNGEEFGQTRLEHLLSRPGDPSAETLAAELDQAVIEFTAGERQDDQALVVLRATG